MTAPRVAGKRSTNWRELDPGAGPGHARAVSRPWYGEQAGCAVTYHGIVKGFEDWARRDRGDGVTFCTARTGGEG